MNLLALLLGLFLEHRLTRLFSLREPRWFDGWFDLALKLMSQRPGWLATLVALPTILLPVVPVLLVSLTFRERLFGLPYVAFAILMLLVSLGPRNLQEDVEDLARARREGRRKDVEHLTRALAEHDLAGTDAERDRMLARAVFVQANNRLFGVILWFVLLGLVGLGPEGAWLFRLSDLLRRRATFEAERRSPGEGHRAPAVVAINRLHGILAWLPARLLAFGYALAGSFDQAITDWKAYLAGCEESYYEATDRVLACAGMGALGPPAPAAPGSADGGPVSRTADGSGASRMEQAMALVNRTLWIWLTGIALLTLVGSIR